MFLVIIADVVQVMSFMAEISTVTIKTYRSSSVRVVPSCIFSY